MSDTAYTPDDLAQRWKVTGKCIRDLCVKGSLSFFKVGKLYRIPAAVVQEYERGMGWNTGSNSTGERGVSSGESKDERAGKALAQVTETKRLGPLTIISGPHGQKIVTR